MLYFVVYLTADEKHLELVKTVFSIISTCCFSDISCIYSSRYIPFTDLLLKLLGEIKLTIYSTSALTGL